MRNILTILIVILFYSCLSKMAHEIGTSSSISRSKERGVFICELQCTVTPDSLNELYNFKFKNVFVERLWRYGDRANETDTTDPTDRGYCHIICAYENESFNNVDENISYRQSLDSVKHNKILSSNSNGFLSSSPFPIVNIKDTISYDIYSCIDSKETEKIGQIKFYPKNVK